MSGHPVSFANFICKFGKKNMLDVAQEIVIPAFLQCNQLNARSYSDTKYFLYQTELLNLSETQKPLLALAGRLVKDTTLRREQTYDAKRGLVRNVGEMDSSPSAIFVLLLNTHKLIYCSETSHAPSISSFRSTVSHYIRQQQKRFVDAEYKRRQALRQAAREAGEDTVERVTKSSIWAEYPAPELEIVPIPSALSLKEFVERYRTLSSISLKVLQTNSELDNSQLLESLRKTGNKLGAKTTAVKHSAGDREAGLDKPEAIAQLGAVAMEGNVSVKLEGKDTSGNRLVGNNEEFRLRVFLQGLSNRIDTAAMQLKTLLQTEIRTNRIRLAQDADEDGSAAKIRQIANDHNV